MAIVQISQMQIRRGLNQDLPQLASGEMGWSLDTRQLYIGNGTLTEGAPSTGVTEILTEFSDLLSVASTYTFKGLASGVIVQTGVDALHPVVRSLQDKLDDIVSVKDFGAVGDGVVDDTAAIQRALTRVFGTAQNVLQLFHHRTINFPAGSYKITSTINVPPFTRIQGEGKKTTIIQGVFEGPLIQFQDGYGQTGYNYGAPAPSGATPDISEYHFNDISFTHNTTNYDQSCILIDGCWTASFTRVMFSGLLTDTTADYGGSTSPTNPVYDIDRGSGVAAVYLRNDSNYQGNRNIVFNECDFFQHNYGLQLEFDNHGITINDCYFDRLYNYVVAGAISSGGYYPYGVTFSNNYLRYSAGPGILCYPNVTQFMSIGNLYTAWGCEDGESSTPINNPADVAMYPAIVYNANENYSIADSFQQDTVNSNIVILNDNGYNCYFMQQGVGVTNGRKTAGIGQVRTLGSTATFASANIINIPSSYTNLTMNYSIFNGSNQRTGTLTISAGGGSYTWNEEYSETVNTQLVFRANPSTGDIEYTSVNTVVLTYSLDYFTV